MPASENLIWEARKFIEIALQDCDDADSVADFAAGRLYDPPAFTGCDEAAHLEFKIMESVPGQRMAFIEQLVREYV
jgi:hypothetical protein